MNGELCYLLTRKEEYAYTLNIYGDQDISLKHMIALGLESFNNFNKESTALSCVNNDVVRYLPYMNLVHIRPSSMSSILSVDPGAKLAS